MRDDTRTSPAGWTVGSSISLELDEALTVACSHYPLADLPVEMAKLVHAIPTSWIAEWTQMMGTGVGAISVLEMAAGLAGVLTDDDYSRVTLGTRELTVAAALSRMVTCASVDGLVPNEELAPAERLVDLAARWHSALYAKLGFGPPTQAQRDRQVRRDMRQVVQILYGGGIGARFWHWLDRFYYEVYRPWRTSRSDAIARLEQRAAMVLGAREEVGVSPEMSWLPVQSPLLRYPELNAAVRNGQVRVFFWVEPMGMFDAWALDPGTGPMGGWTLFVSFAEPGELYRNFRAFTVDLASRAASLADPTRLIILRMIRQFDMVNTEIAGYLELSRPTVSVHAKILREAGLIRSAQDGRLVRHEIVPAEVRRLFRDLEGFLDLPEEETAPVRSNGA
jgi:DNA-binding transcriptional ArsR family regulator